MKRGAESFLLLEDSAFLRNAFLDEEPQSLKGNPAPPQILSTQAARGTLLYPHQAWCDGDVLAFDR
jgi:hypothetical protein